MKYLFRVLDPTGHLAVLGSYAPLRWGGFLSFPLFGDLDRFEA